MTMDWAELMRHGRFEDAWRICDRETHVRPADMWTRPRHLQTLWNGTPIVGRRILIHCYHGLGDTLQFIRYVPAAQRLAREVTLWVQPELIELLEATGVRATLLPLHNGEPDVERDLDIEVMELPHIFRTTLDSIPSRTPYLLLPNRSERHSPDAIGLMWRAGDWDLDRSIPLEAFAELLSVGRLHFFPLANPLTANESSFFDPVVPAVSDVLALARVLLNCRLVIAVDTMAAHLAGALNVPTWTLLKHECDWRWMVDREDTPWYPSMRLYRQHTPGAWGPVLARVERDLRRLAAESNQRTETRVASQVAGGARML
jgi:hypothetical protein